MPSLSVEANLNLSIIIACHNRRELTVRCIEKAKAAADYAGAKASFTVFDDGSTDGSADAIARLPVSARILTGDGSAYWARSMAFAETSVLGDASVPENGLIVWLNDDVELDVRAFAALAETVERAPGSVVVGAMRDPLSGETTYSGMRKTGFHPLKFDLVPATGCMQSVDTFNGNLVLVPVGVARQLCGIDGGFSHALADIDYGLRCGRLGTPVILAPATYGTCPRNELPRPRSIRSDWRAFVGPKGGGNFASLVRILRRTNRRGWPVVIAATYGLWWARRLRVALHTKGTL